jgi:ABC-type lipoprotein export system ATPase subunit
MGESQIECISLGKQYTRNKQTINVLNDINLTINRNEIVMIKGRSGAGKSTLLNLMCGLIKPTSGKVIIENKCISDLPNNELSGLLSNHVGIIFQSFNLLPTYTIYENIEIAIVPDGLKPRLNKDVIMSFLEQFNLKDKANLLPAELSVGQQQKVAIIRTLVRQPSIIFADEPTGSVDDETAGEILHHLKYLKEQKEATVVIATHGTVPESFADRVIFIENGQIKSNK